MLVWRKAMRTAIWSVVAAFALVVAIGVRDAAACPGCGCGGECKAEGKECPCKAKGMDSPECKAKKAGLAAAADTCGGDCKCGCKDGKACDCAASGDKCGKDCKCGCQEGKPCTCPGAASAVASGTVPAGMIGKDATCPVSGEKFKIAAGTTFSEYQGTTYYFCCAGCKPRFDKEPAKYAKK
jgi:YHS domain-containing protein